MSIERFKVVVMFLIAVLAALIFWGFILRGWAVHHADNPAVKGLMALTN
jgi:hypothetical protein